MFHNMYPNKLKTTSTQKPVNQMFIAVIFTILKNGINHDVHHNVND